MSNEKRNKSFKKKDRKDDKNNEYLLIQILKAMKNIFPYH